MHLFAGAGGGILADLLLGHVPVCAVEIDPYCRSVLLARQRDGILPRFPIWDDVQTFDGEPWRGHVDVVAGGFPCQDISCAGKGDGLSGDRSGLWSEMARICGEVRPRFVFVENSPMLTSRGLGVVLGDLAALGFDARWGVLGARHAGAPHRRDRIWIVARDRDREPAMSVDDEVAGVSRGVGLADTDSEGSQGRDREVVRERPGERFAREGDSSEISDTAGAEPNGWGDWPRRGRWVEVDDGRRDAETTDWWKSEPDVGRVADGVASRVDRLRALGNGQVPQVAALAWEILR